VIRTVGISLQHAKMIDDFLNCHHPGTLSTNGTGRLVYLISNGHVLRRFRIVSQRFFSLLHRAPM
jgi:hypothetical protein